MLLSSSYSGYHFSEGQWTRMDTYSLLFQRRSAAQRSLLSYENASFCRRWMIYDHLRYRPPRLQTALSAQNSVADLNSVPFLGALQDDHLPRVFPFPPHPRHNWCPAIEACLTVFERR